MVQCIKRSRGIKESQTCNRPFGYVDIILYVWEGHFLWSGIFCKQIESRNIGLIKVGSEIEILQLSQVSLK